MSMLSGKPQGSQISFGGNVTAYDKMADSELLLLAKGSQPDLEARKALKRKYPNMEFSW